MERLRWGVLGTGAVTPQFVRACREGDSSVVHAVASREREKADLWASAYDAARAYDSYDALIDSGEAEALYIALPNALHAEWALRALRAGIPVLCEKPLAANAVEAAAIARESHARGVVAAEAFMFRFHPVYDRLAELLSERAIGEVVFIRAAFSFLLEDRTQTPASAELAGGALLDVGCYGAGFARLVTAAEPLRVAAFERRSSVDDTMAGILEFPGGVLAQIDCSIEAEERQFAEIVGTKGSIALPSPWLPGEASGELVVRRGGAEVRIAAAGANCYRLEVDDFAAAVRERREPRWPIEDAVRNMAALDAIREAARTRSVQAVRPPAL